MEDEDDEKAIPKTAWVGHGQKSWPPHVEILFIIKSMNVRDNNFPQKFWNNSSKFVYNRFLGGPFFSNILVLGT